MLIICKNIIVGIIQAEYGLAPSFPVHRLERFVLGLLILIRSACRADYRGNRYIYVFIIILHVQWQI